MLLVRYRKPGVLDPGRGVEMAALAPALRAMAGDDLPQPARRLESHCATEAGAGSDLAHSTHLHAKRTAKLAYSKKENYEAHD